jgi:L-asparaginase II
LKSRQPLIVEVLRGPIVESVHHVIVAVADYRSALSGFWGNAEYVVFPRSAIKPLQAISFVESGAVEHFSLNHQHIALACASHRAEKYHIDILKQWLSVLKLQVSDLYCGVRSEGEPDKPSALFHNCSGKHLAMISSCLAHGEDPTTYFKWESAEQKRIRKILSELTKLDHEKLTIGVDGCGLPTISLPLQNIALAMTCFFSDALPEKRKKAIERIANAMQTAPELLSADGELVTDINRASKGQIILKSGAEGVYAGLCFKKKHAFALKSIDGSKRAAEFACLHVLKELGSLSEAQAPLLQKYLTPQILNSRGESVGTYRIGKS